MRNEARQIGYILDLSNGWGFQAQCDEEECYLLGAEMANYGDATADAASEWPW